MVISSSCFLNLSPPLAASGTSSLPTKTTSVALGRTEKERSWRKQCVLGVACIIIGLEMDNLVGSAQGKAITQDVESVSESKEKSGERWSDQRTCQPWRLNALENIVPENLPRPSARRRWEAAGYSRVAPAVKVLVRNSDSSCFSM